MPYTRTTLSGSTDGNPIKVVATATPGTTIHTAHATALDAVYLWATNTDTVSRNLTLEWGGTTDPDNLIVDTAAIPAGLPPVLLIDGQHATNSRVIRAFASAANVILVSGYIIRIT